MTVAITVTRNQYAGNGSTVVFPYEFQIESSSELIVLKTDGNVDPEVTTLMTLTTDYTVSDVGEPAGGDVTTVDTLIDGERITILRNTPETQTTDFENSGGYFAVSIEDSVDKLTRIVQENTESLTRAVLAEREYTGTTTPGEDLKDTLEANLSLEDTYRKSEADEIHVTTLKATPVDADVLLIEDSEATWAKKRIAISSLPDNQTFNSPLTTKGDLLGFDTDDARLAVGTDGQVLEADSSETLGVKWATKSATDANAIHTDEANEISTLVAKAVVADADLLIIEDSEDSGNKKKISMSSLPTDPSAIDANAIHVGTPDEISSIASKATPIAGDYLVIEDSADSNNKKSVTLNTLPTTSAVTSALNLKADDADLTTHENDTTNPHVVTKAQVGLSYVDNTSDLDKPISTDTQTALDTKARNVTTFHSTTGGEFPVLNNKATPADGDYILIEDSEDNNYKKYITVDSLGGGSGSSITKSRLYLGI